jgi:hypothetical protein
MYEYWYEEEREPLEYGRSDAQTVLEIAEDEQREDKYGIMGSWDWRVNRMLKDPVIWAGILRVANRLYAEGGLEAEVVEQALMRVVKKAQAAGYQKATKFNRRLYELRKNFKKFEQERIRQTPPWEL